MQLARHAYENGHAGAVVINAILGNELVNGCDEFRAWARILRQGTRRYYEA